jgi:hypothetical protein
VKIPLIPIKFLLTSYRAILSSNLLHAACYVIIMNRKMGETSCSIAGKGIPGQKAVIMMYYCTVRDERKYPLG